MRFNFHMLGYILIKYIYILEMLPLVYFSHADIKNAESLNGKLSFIEDQAGKTSLGKMKLSKKLKLTIENESMNYEATQEDESSFMISILDQDKDELSTIETPSMYLNLNDILINQTMNLLMRIKMNI